MNHRRANLLAVLTVAFVLGGCASGVTRMDGQATSAPTAQAQAPAPRDVKSVNLWLNNDAKKLLPENLKFNQDTLRSTVERALNGNGIMKPESAQVLDIEITSFRVRSNFSAIMFGFMAGNDNVEGIVTIKNHSGAPLKRAKVSASYALGGIGGGQDDARMGWLYEEFAKHAVAEVIGTPAGK